MDAARLLAEAQAISKNSPAIKAFCLDAAAALAELDARLAAISAPPPTPSGQVTGLPLMLRSY